MSAIRSSSSAPTTGRRRTPVVALAVALAVLAAVGVAVWWFLFRDDAPAPVDIQTAVSGLDEEATGAVDGIEGTWVVDRTVVGADGQGSFVGFRVDELAQGIGHNTVVARTTDVDGEVAIDGTTVERADVTADLRTLASDDQRRDGRMREAIAAEQFPDGTFRLTEPIDLGDVEEGRPVQVPAKGELTVKGVTAPVTVDVQAQLTGDVVTVVGSGPIVFADHQVTAPTAPLVLAVEDNGVIELLLHLRRG